MSTTIPASQSASAGASDDAARGVRLLAALPELGRGIPEEDRPLAWRALVAPLAEVPAGPLEGDAVRANADTSRFAIVLDGIVLKTTLLDDRAVTEIAGEADILDLGADTDGTAVETVTRYVVHRRATIAFIGDRFRLAARRWPALHDALYDQLARQSRRASTHLAILQQPRVDDRITAVFTDLSDRLGRVTPDGIVLDLPLTHELIGRMVGARRPTVSLALAELAQAGTLVRRLDGAWLLTRPKAE